MKKADAIRIMDFIEQHYDMVWQDDWFDFCDMLGEIVISEANKGRYAGDLAKKYPFFFAVAE